MADEQRYEESDTVRAMLGREVSDEEITKVARSLGWPLKSPHPFLVADRIHVRCHG